MTPSAHKNFTMEKSTATRSNTSDNLTQPPDHSKTPDTSNEPNDKVLGVLNQNLHSKNKSSENTSEKDDIMAIQMINLLNCTSPYLLQIHITTTREIT